MALSPATESHTGRSAASSFDMAAVNNSRRKRRRIIGPDIISFETRIRERRARATRGKGPGASEGNALQFVSVTTSCKIVACKIEKPAPRCTR